MNPLVPGSSPGGPTIQYLRAAFCLSVVIALAKWSAVFKSQNSAAWSVDRIQVNSALVVLCFVSVLLLDSQSAASYSSYLLLGAMLWNFRQWDDVLRLPYFLAILVLQAYLLGSVSWSANGDLARFWSMLARVLLILAFTIALAECALRGHVQRWLGNALALVGSAAAIAAIAVFYITDPPDGRLNGLGQLDTHVIAALVFSVVAIFVMRTLLTVERPAQKAMCAFCIGLILYAVYLSDSRNAWVSLCIGGSCFVMATLIQNVRDFALSFLLMILNGLVVALVVSQNVYLIEAIAPRGDSFRLAIWQASIERIENCGVLFGCGITTPDSVSVGAQTFQHPHNMYLAVFFQGGLLGLGTFLLVIIWSVGILLRAYESPDSKLALSLFALALSSYLLDGHELVDKVGETWFLFWLPVALTLSLKWGRMHRAGQA